jgi:hypothetical protein
MNLFLNVLRKASPLAASFGKLHLWRLDELVSERSFTSGGFLREASPLAASRASFRKRVPRVPRVLRGTRFLKEARGTCILREDGASRAAAVLYSFLRLLISLAATPSFLRGTPAVSEDGDLLRLTGEITIFLSVGERSLCK